MCVTYEFKGMQNAEFLWVERIKKKKKKKHFTPDALGE
jgi:hypothetical protein